MQIVEATPEDVPQLCKLLELLFSQEAEFRPDAVTQARGLFAVIGFPERGHILVLRDGTSIAGMVNLLFTVSTALGSRVALLEDMVIHPSHRGSGSGSALLRAAIDIARDSGCQRVTLPTDGDNTSAQRFYHRHGFATSGMVPLRLSLPPPHVA